MNAETLGDWCKWLEKNFSPEQMIPLLPVIIRLDGNNFSKWTKGLEKPFDDRLMNLMAATTEALVKETNAIVGYTQSDEITLILYSNNRKSSIYHDGKKQKILSKLTGFTVNHFNEKAKDLLPGRNKLANFDCRIYQTPTLHDATVQLLWRELDATRNSIQSLAQANFSHKSLHGLDTSQIQDRLMTMRRINWNDLETSKKRGMYFKRTIKNTKFSQAEIDSLPEKHEARRNPDLNITRSVIERIEYPIFNTITNKEDVIFKGQAPIVKSDTNVNQV